MSMRKYFLLILLISSALCADAQVPEPVVSAENRPFVRWWWLGSAVDEEGITWNLEEFASAGLGGVEITPIYGVKDNERNDVEYLSPRWMQLYAHTVNEAERLGLQVDLNNGTGWPFGGPHITTDYSAKKFLYRTFKVNAGVPLRESLALTDKRQKVTASVQCVVAVYDSERLDISSFVRGKEKTADGLYLAKDSVLEWTPESDAEVYVLYIGHTYQKVKRAAPGGEGLVLDHYNKDALDHYFGRFECAFSASGAPWPDTFFNDSFEVYGSDWAGDLLDSFAKMHGYRLEHWLPEFLGEGDPDTHARIVTDYRQTLAFLLEENFTKPWTQWAHSKGARTRNQAHGSPANIIDIYAVVDIPECESFGRSEFDIPGLRQDSIRKPNDGDPAVLKFASSAAHLTGKKYTSAEALTWLTEHFRTSLSQCKPEIDQMFASGVNHIYFHGAPYSPKGASFPGWKFYAAINMSPTNNIWNHAPAFFDYVTRCQSFLTDGRPDNDVLLYVPLYDIWHQQQEKQFLIFDIHKMDITMPGVKAAMNEIVSGGYDADYLSDSFLQGLQVKNGMLESEEGTLYKALLVPACHKMPLESLEKLLSLCKDGANIIFMEHLPDDVPGFGNLDQRRKEFERLLKKIRRKAVICVDYKDALEKVGASYEPFKGEMGGTMIRQTNKEGGYDYFMAMLSNNPVHDYVRLGAMLPSEWDGTVWVCDPLDGEWNVAEHKYDGASLSVFLNLDPGESVLLRVVPEKAKANGQSPRHSKYALGQEIVLSDNWVLSFPESDPKIDSVYKLDSLMPWTAIEDEVLKINCGTGLYRTEFLTPDLDADTWILDLGDVCESARVRINDRIVGTAFSVPYRLWLDRDLLAPVGGVNVLEIEVCNLPSNRIADFERRGVEWRIFKDANISSVTGAKQFSFSEWPTDPSGLNSEVKLIAVTYR